VSDRGWASPDVLRAAARNLLEQVRALTEERDAMAIKAAQLEADRDAWKARAEKAEELLEPPAEVHE